MGVMVQNKVVLFMAHGVHGTLETTTPGQISISICIEPLQIGVVI